MEYKIQTHKPKIRLYPEKYIKVRGKKVLCPYGYTEEQILKIIKNNDYVKIFNLHEMPLYKLPTNKLKIYEQTDTNVYAFPILVAPRVFNTKILTENDTFFIPDEIIWKGFAESMVLIKLDTNMTQSGLVSQARISLCKTLTTSIYGFKQDIYEDGVDGDTVPVSAKSEEISQKLLNQINCFEIYYF